MKRDKKPNKPDSPSLAEYLKTYDLQTLRGALLTFEASTGWAVMLAYISTVQRRYEIDALDMIGKEGRDPRAAAYASGYAKACEDMKIFPEGLHQTILGGDTVTEVPRPEE